MTTMPLQEGVTMKDLNEGRTVDFVDHVAQKVRTVTVGRKITGDTWTVFEGDGTMFYAHEDDLHEAGESGYESVPDDPDEIILLRSADRTKVIIEAPQQEDSRIELSRDGVLDLVVRLTKADLEWDTPEIREWLERAPHGVAGVTLDTAKED